MQPVFSREDLLEYGVAEVIGGERLRARLADGETLTVKFGIDPTSSSVHVGRSIALWRLRAFQALGHRIEIVIGDTTAQVGDTSDKQAERPALGAEAVSANLATYETQLRMVLDPDRMDQVRFRRNSEWLGGLTLPGLLRLASAFSVNAFIKRELIARRLEAGGRVGLPELLYPVMQGYDSVELQADVEIGGTDQRFNLLAGRTLQERAGQEPQAVIMHTLIRGTDGKKMSSSAGNVIALDARPVDLFGGMMASRDEVAEEYLAIFPRSLRPFTPAQLRTRLRSGENPRDLKMEMALRLVALYHGGEAAAAEGAAFTARFSEGVTGSDWPEHPAGGTVLELLTSSGLASSNSEGRRLLEQGGVKSNGSTLSDPDSRPAAGTTLTVGKRNGIKLS